VTRVVVGFLDPDHTSTCFTLSYRDLCVRDALTAGHLYRQGGAELRALTGAGGIAVNRNKVARDFLKTDGEWLWFIDTDMGFEDDTVERLLAAADPVARPVMGGLCFAAIRPKGIDQHPLRAQRYLIQPTVYGYVDEDGEVGFRPILDYPRDTVVECSATGAACLLIHRTALEKVQADCGEAWFDPIVHPTGLKGRPRTFSEDLSFCVRLAKVGIPVHVDTSVKTTHEKGFLYLDEETFQAQQAAM
jgi:GT2 family glycosyltransferase